MQKLFYYTLLEKEHKKKTEMGKWENIPNEMGALNMK